MIGRCLTRRRQVIDGKPRRMLGGSNAFDRCIHSAVPFAFVPFAQFYKHNRSINCGFINCSLNIKISEPTPNIIFHSYVAVAITKGRSATFLSDNENKFGFMFRLSNTARY